MNTYDPKKILVSFRGIPLTGFAPDTFVSVDRNEDAFTLVVGSDGETTRTQNRNRSGTVTLTLMSGSQSNSLMAAIAARDEQSGDGTGEVLVKELNGATLVSGKTAWVRKVPTVEFAKDDTTRTWVLEADELLIFSGGRI
jgi:hypothetical protein